MKGEENKRNLLSYTYYDEYSYSTHISDIKKLIERINYDSFKERIEKMFASMMLKGFEPAGFDSVIDDWKSWQYSFGGDGLGVYVPDVREELAGYDRYNGLYSKKHYETMIGFIKEDLSRTVDLRTLLNIPLKDMEVS